MFPIGDDNTRRRATPVVTFVLIAINVLVFLLELNAGEAFIREWALIPREFSNNPAGEAVTLFSAMFMHGGWLHLFGNMLYLWIFGDNVEDEFGSGGFLLFYLVCGLAAFAAQFMVAPPRRDRRRVGSLSADVSTGPRQCAGRAADRGHARANRARLVDRTTSSPVRARSREQRRQRTPVGLPTWPMSAALLPAL